MNSDERAFQPEIASTSHVLAMYVLSNRNQDLMEREGECSEGNQMAKDVLLVFGHVNKFGLRLT